MRTASITLDTVNRLKTPAISFFAGEALVIYVTRGSASGSIVMAVGAEGSTYDLDTTPLVEVAAAPTDTITLSASALAPLGLRRSYPFTIWAGGIVAASGSLCKLHAVSQTVVDFGQSWILLGASITSSPPPPPAAAVSGSQIIG